MDKYVEIVEFETGKVEKRMGPMGERQAERVERGVSVNLNHDDYFVRVVDADEAQPATATG